MANERIYGGIPRPQYTLDHIDSLKEDEVFPGYAFREGIIEGILQKIAHQNKGFSISLNGTIVPKSF